MTCMAITSHWGGHVSIVNPIKLTLVDCWFYLQVEDQSIKPTTIQKYNIVLFRLTALQEIK